MFKLVVIIMYITHNIMYWVNYYLIRVYEFATYRNPTCPELMREHTSSGVLKNQCIYYQINAEKRKLNITERRMNVDLMVTFSFHGMVALLLMLTTIEDPSLLIIAIYLICPIFV